jgi:hypothetical protein
MTPQERLARSQRAEAAYRDFIEPMIDALKEEYAYRIVEVANAELNSKVRADKLTGLSIAHRIVTTLDGGMKSMIADGELALPAKLRADKIEQMTAPKRRLLNIGGW